MPDLITGPIDPTAGLAAKGASVATPSSMFSGIDPFETSEQLIRQGGYNIARYGYVDPETHLQLTEPEPNASPEELKQLEVPDSPDMKGLHFTSPLPLSVAQTMHDAKQEEIMRASIADNQPGGVLNTVGRTAVNFAAGMLDPVNIAASLIPVAGEARMGAALLRSLGDEIGGRVATNFVTGAARGAVGQVPLVAARYGMSQQEQADYSASNAMADLVMGTLLGGGLHTVVEGAHDWLGSRFSRTPEAAIVEADPAAREATMRAAVAAVAEDRPVDVAAYIRLSNEDNVRLAQVAALRREAEALRGEAAGVPNFTEGLESPDSLVHPPAPDEATQARLDAVLDELTNPQGGLTAARAAELQAEHRMLTEGRQPGTDLEQARSDAQRQGLLIAAQRTEQRIADLMDQIKGSETVRRAAGAPDAEMVRLGQQADAATVVKPPETPEMAPEPDAETLAARMQQVKAAIDNGDTRGMLTQGERDELKAMDEAQANSEGEAKAFEAAAQCFLQGLI